MRFVFLFSFFIVFVSANVEHEINESSSFELPSDWSSIRSNIDTSFSCIGRAFGYYADVANDCQVYHVCQPRVENEITVYRHSPFICPLNTVFDQQVLACVHSAPEFSCANQVNYYAETENRLANVSVENVNPNVVSNNVASPPERVEVPIAPVVESNVVHKPIAERIAQPWSDGPALAVNVDLYGVQPSQILPAENAPVHNNVAPLITPPTNVRSNISAAPILNNTVLSNDESAEVSNVHPVSSVIGVMHVMPVHSRVSPQNQESLKMELPKNYETVSKSIALPITKREIEHPVKAAVQVVKSQQQVQQIHSFPVKAPMPVKAPQQQVQQIHSVPVKAPMPVKAPQQQEQQVQQIHSVPIKAPEPVKSPIAQQVVSQIQVPTKSMNNVAKQQYFVRSHTNLHNSQPSWRHHYVRLYPSLIHNNPYHVRHVARLV